MVLFFITKGDKIEIITMVEKRERKGEINMAVKKKPIVVRLREKGQITLPLTVRQLLNLETGDVLKLKLVEGKIVLEPLISTEEE